MDRRIYSVKVSTQASSIWVYVMTTQKDQSPKILSLGSQKFMHFTEKFSMGLRQGE